jgi:hypothetical protein
MFVRNVFWYFTSVVLSVRVVFLCFTLVGLSVQTRILYFTCVVLSVRTDMQCIVPCNHLSIFYLQPSNCISQWIWKYDITDINMFTSYLNVCFPFYLCFILFFNWKLFLVSTHSSCTGLHIDGVHAVRLTYTYVHITISS